MKDNKKYKILFDMSHTGYGVTGIQQDLRMSMEAVIKSQSFDVSLLWYDVLGYFDLYKFKIRKFRNIQDKISSNSQMLSVLTGSDTKITEIYKKFPIYKIIVTLSNFWNIYFKSKFGLFHIDKLFNETMFKKFLANGMGAKFRKDINGLDIFLMNMCTHSLYNRLTRFENFKLPTIDTTGFDVVFFPTEVPINISKNSLKIIRLYDLIPIKNPDIVGGGRDRSIFQYRSILACINQKSVFVSISKTVMDEFVEMFPETNSSVFYVEPPVSDIFKKSDSDFSSLERLLKLRFCRRLGYNEREIKNFFVKFFENPDFEYILHVGTIEPRKNLINLIKAYNLAVSKRRKEDKPLKLILAGSLGWLYDEILKIANPFIRNGDLLILEGTATGELSDLYSHAKLFAWLSFAEGWGMPPLEAMRCGCPVVSSDIQVHRESQGEASIFVDPYDVGEISRTFLFLLDPSNDIKRQEMIQKGYLQSNKYSISLIGQKWSDLFLELTNRGLLGM